MTTWRDSREYRIWRVLVIRRDSVCQICGNLKAREAHHMNHATYFPEARFNITNGVTLCSKCHKQFHNNFKNSTREKCTIADFNNFKVLAKYLKGL